MNLPPENEASTHWKRKVPSLFRLCTLNWTSTSWPDKGAGVWQIIGYDDMGTKQEKITLQRVMAGVPGGTVGEVITIWRDMYENGCLTVWRGGPDLLDPAFLTGAAPVHQTAAPTPVTQVHVFEFCSCIHESAFAVVSVHHSKKDAFKAMMDYVHRAWNEDRDFQCRGFSGGSIRSRPLTQAAWRIKSYAVEGPQQAGQPSALETAIEEVIDWLNYEHGANDGIKASIMKLRDAWMFECLRIQRGSRAVNDRTQPTA